MDMITTSVRMSTAHRQKWDEVARAMGTNRNAAISRLLEVVEIRSVQRTVVSAVVEAQAQEEPPCPK